MTLSAADTLAVFILSAIGAAIGSFITAYLRRKGENLATHEDIQKVVDQVKATTAATESIRTDLSGKLWETQERWKLKSDLYIGLVRDLSIQIRQWEALHYIRTHYQAGTRAEEDALNDWTKAEQARVEAARAVRAAQAVGMIVNDQIATILDEMWSNTDDLGTTFVSEIEDRVKAMRAALEAIIAESRRDLRVGAA